MSTRFYFATCQTGAEKHLKNEILKELPALKFAFSRPGFVTFKYESENKKDIAPQYSVFTRLWGKVIGQVKDLKEVPELFKKIPAGAIVHLFERDLFVPGDEPETFVDGAKVRALYESLPKETKKNFKVNAKPKLGEEVFDLIWVDDFHLFLGQHYQSDFTFPHPGNKAWIELPKESPSRAYLKIEEAIQLFKPELKDRMKILEVGCSPGGATLALLNRGMIVTGIDPKKMAPVIHQNPDFVLIKKPAKAIESEELKEFNPDWIVMDMNIAPLEALDELHHMLGCMRKNFGRKMSLRGGLLTLKLNDWKFAESIPLYLKRLNDFGFKKVTPIQLSHNRQEIFVMAEGFQPR